jgi:Tfp pilus assembly protein PilX
MAGASLLGHKGAPRRPGASQQRGVALLQALLLSMVIALLLLQLVFTARGQLRVAAEIEERVAADLLLYSARSEALFSLLVSIDSVESHIS